MKILKYAIISILALGFMSCDGDDDPKVDNTQPTISLNSPTSSVVITPGGILSVNANLSDNVMLDEYVVKISTSGTKSAKNVEEFYFSSYTDLDAYGNALPEVQGKKSLDLKFDIGVDDNTRVGVYTFSLALKDKAGNASEEIVQFEIVRP